MVTTGRNLSSLSKNGNILIHEMAEADKTTGLELNWGCMQGFHGLPVPSFCISL